MPQVSPLTGTETLLLPQLTQGVVVQPVQVYELVVVVKELGPHTTPLAVTGSHVAVTETAAVVFEQNGALLLVKVNVTLPFELPVPVTRPLLVTVANAELLLTQVPPLVGDSWVVDVPNMDVGPVMLTTGNALTVIEPVVLEHPRVLVKVKVAVPLDKPVTTPPLVTEATEGLLLTQVPPLVGESWLVPFTHIDVLPVMLTVGGVTDTEPVLTHVVLGQVLLSARML